MATARTSVSKDCTVSMWRLSRCQMRIVPSSLSAAAYIPSGDKATDQTTPIQRPSIVKSPVAISHRRTSLSLPPETRCLPEGENTIDRGILQQIGREHV